MRWRPLPLPVLITHDNVLYQSGVDQGRGPISDQPTSQLPATIQQAEVAIDQRAPNVVPALIADLGDAAAWRYVEFFVSETLLPSCGSSVSLTSLSLTGRS